MRRVLAAALAAAGVLTAAGCASPGEEDRFRQTCTEQGGFVAQTGQSFWTARIDCIKDNRVVYLPGFA